LFFLSYKNISPTFHSHRLTFFKLSLEGVPSVYSNVYSKGGFEVLKVISMKSTTDASDFSLIDSSRATYSPDDEGNNNLWNAGKHTSLHGATTQKTAIFVNICCTDQELLSPLHYVRNRKIKFMA
jgi:hypothetical protein